MATNYYFILILLVPGLLSASHPDPLTTGPRLGLHPGEPAAY